MQRAARQNKERRAAAAEACIAPIVPADEAALRAEYRELVARVA